MSLALDWLRIRRGEDPIVYLDDVFRYAMACLNHREDAEDIASEVVQALPNPSYRRDLRPYMIGVARRKIIDHVRRSKPTMSIFEVDAVSSFDALSDQTTMVTAVLAALLEDHREVLILKYLVGLTSEEIGPLMSRKPEAIDSLLQRARASFASEWTRVSKEEVDW